MNNNYIDNIDKFLNKDDNIDLFEILSISLTDEKMRRSQNIYGS